VSATDDLLANAAAYALSFDAGNLAASPVLGVAVVTCMDARVDPARLLGLTEGDAHVIRNAGGVVGDDEIRSISLSQHLLGTREVIVVQHTDCGLLGLSDEEFADKLEAEAGQRPDWAARGFADLEASLRASLERIRTSPFIPLRDSVRGFVYDVADGTLREVR